MGGGSASSNVEETVFIHKLFVIYYVPGVKNRPNRAHTNKIVRWGLFLFSPKLPFSGPLLCCTAFLLSSGTFVGIPSTGHSKLGISLSPFILMVEFQEFGEENIFFLLLQIIPHDLSYL